MAQVGHSITTYIGGGAMNTIPTTTKNQATKSPSGNQGDKKERQIPDDRQEVGLIAAIMVVLALGVLGYWLFEESNSRATGTESAAIPDASKDWEKNDIKKGESTASEMASSLVLPVSADMVESPTQGQPPIRTQIERAVYFDFNQHTLTAETKSLVQEEFTKRGEGGDWTVSIEGHTDELGPEPYNQALGLKRAESIKQFLLGLGASEKSIQVTSMGETSPVCREKAEDCYHKNRRVHMLWNQGKLVTQTSQPPTESAQMEGDIPIKLATASTEEKDSDLEQPSPLKSEETP